jgi:hypothetical protein
MEKTKSEASQSVRATKMKEQGDLGCRFLHRRSDPGALRIAGRHDGAGNGFKRHLKRAVDVASRKSDETCSSIRAIDWRIES